jgi:nucleoside-diphosphate-sugar epimerase
VKVLVTGATGFLGGWVCTKLVATGHAVRALVRPQSDLSIVGPLGVETVAGAIEDRTSLARAVDGVDAIVHGAGLTMALRREDFERVNVGGTENLFAAVRASGAQLRRFVHISSLAVVGPSDGPWPPPADRPPSPVTTYGRTKAKGEAIALAAAPGIPVTVIRPPVVYGPRDRELLRVFRAAARGLLPVFAGAGAVSLIHAEDCASAIETILRVDPPAGRVYAVDDGPPHTPEEIARAAAAAVGRRGLRIPIPRFAIYPAAAVSGAFARLRRRPTILTLDKAPEIAARFQVAGHEAITRDLGWRPAIAMGDGFRSTAAWYREHGWL